MTYPIPEQVFQDHIALVAKTGAGKTSAAKTMVEHFDPATRVCIIDPVKSDWWGLTSSGDGKRPGLPFTILGGPHGHVPLNSAAGAAIGELVAKGALPRCIIDTRQFEFGGLQRFFMAFAKSLMDNMRGVMHLVLEEAHRLAPKEKAGVPNENMATHYAKELATGGRSMGIRLIVATQRTQALHNAVLGSCETLVAMRLTTPADQKPVADWLKKKATKEAREEILESLGRLETGSGWLYSGELGLFERIKFPRIKTYDNSRTPTGDEEAQEVRTAPVDLEKLQAIIGDAVKDAQASDPKTLRAALATKDREIVNLRHEIDKLNSRPAAEVGTFPRDVVNEMLNEAVAEGGRRARKASVNLLLSLGLSLDKVAEEYDSMRKLIRDEIVAIEKEPAVSNKPIVTVHVPSTVAPLGTRVRSSAVERRVSTPQAVSSNLAARSNGHAGEKLSKAERLVLGVLANFPEGATNRKTAIMAGYAVGGGGFNNALSSLRTRGYLDGSGTLRLTPTGFEAAGAVTPLPTGQALLEYWKGHKALGKAERLILEQLVNGGPSPADGLANATGYALEGGGFGNALSRLRTLELIEGKSHMLRAAEEFNQ